MDNNPDNYVSAYKETIIQLDDSSTCPACSAVELYKELRPVGAHFLTHKERGKIAACMDIEGRGHLSSCKKKKKL